jgi:hypothetical protein
MHEDRKNRNQRCALMSGHSWQIDKFASCSGSHQVKKAKLFPPGSGIGCEYGVAN